MPYVTRSTTRAATPARATPASEASSATVVATTPSPERAAGGLGEDAARRGAPSEAPTRLSRLYEALLLASDASDALRTRRRLDDAFARHPSTVRPALEAFADVCARRGDLARRRGDATMTDEGARPPAAAAAAAAEETPLLVVPLHVDAPVLLDRA